MLFANSSEIIIYSRQKASRQACATICKQTTLQTYSNIGGALVCTRYSKYYDKLHANQIL